MYRGSDLLGRERRDRNDVGRDGFLPLTHHVVRLRLFHRPRHAYLFDLGNAMSIDVLSRDAVVVTARYTIPHWTPEGRPHVLGGAWTSVWTHRQGRWAIVHEHLSDLPREVAERVEATMPAAPPGSRS